MGNIPKSNYYKNAILKEFPDSDYAKLINNPNYIKQLEAKKNKLENYYSNTYRAYRMNQFKIVISRCEQSDSLFPDNKLKPKFAYLRATAIGKSREIQYYEAALNDVIAKFPADEVKVEAEETLALIAALKITLADTLSQSDTVTSPGEGISKEEEKKSPELYSLNKESTHYYVMVVADSIINVDDLKRELSDYNAKFFRLKKLRTSNMLLNTELHIIMVKNFGDSENGIDYFKSIRENLSSLPSLPKDKYREFIISAENFPVLYKDKQIDEYLSFFQKNYLEG